MHRAGGMIRALRAYHAVAMRHLVTLVPVLLTVGACSRGEAPKSGGKSAVCDDLAITGEVTKAIYQQAGLQLASELKAIEKAEKKTSDERGTDDPSDDRRRAFAYERTATALCYTAQQTGFALRLMAGRSDVVPHEDVARWEGAVTKQMCTFGIRSASAETVTAEWSAGIRTIEAAEEHLVQGCYERTGGSRPALMLPPMLLANE